MSEAQRVNEFGQPIGFAVPDWRRPPHPSRVTLSGRFCCLDPTNFDAAGRQRVPLTTLTAPLLVPASSLP